MSFANNKMSRVTKKPRKIKYVYRQGEKYIINKCYFVYLDHFDPWDQPDKASFELPM